MKFTKIVSVTVTVVGVVVLLFISLKLEVNRRSARDKSIARDILINKLKRSLKDDRKFGPSGIESDVDDTRDTDLHDRRELMGDGEINSDSNGGIYRKRRMSEKNTDNHDMLDRPSRSEKDVTPSMEEVVTDAMPEILTLPDYRLKNKSSIYIDSSIRDMKTTRETNSADENDDEVDVENNEEGRFKRGLFDGDDDEDDDVEHFFERYKRSSNEVEDNSDSIDDEESDDDTGDDDGRFRKGIAEENIEEDDNEEDDDEYLHRQRRESYENMEDEDDDEEDDADDYEYLHRQRRESYQNIEDDDEESEHLNRQRRDIYKNANFFHHNGEKTNPAIDTAYVKDVYSDELYNPPYNLVPSIAKKRRSLSSHDTEKIYDNEKEAGEEKDDKKKRRSLSSKNQDTEKIDNEDDIENEEEGDEVGLKKRDLGDFDEDNDIETEDNEGNVEDRKRDADDNDTEESDLKDNDISNADASDSENTANNNVGELKKILLTKLKQYKKRNINIKKDLLYDNNHHLTTTIKPVNPEQKGQQNKSILIRKPRNHEKTELIDDIAFDEVDNDPNSGYTQWEEWGPCSVTCGVGRSERRRKCTEQTHCKSGDLEQRVCMTDTCDDDD